MNYTFRMHDPRVGRFFAVDPLFKSYPYNSPYAFAENDVMQFIELEGAEKGEALKKARIFPVPVLKTATETLTKQLAKQVVENVAKNGGSQILKTTIAEGAAETIGSGLATTLTTLFMCLVPQSTNDQPVPHADLKPFPKNLIFPSSEKANDDKITLYRGVPSLIPGTVKETPNPAYFPATQGTAVPQGGTDDPYLANYGIPSNYTFWTLDKDIARDFATDGDVTNGILLKKDFPKEVLSNNTSPDRYSEGEVQIPGTVTGATPIPVEPEKVKNSK